MAPLEDGPAVEVVNAVTALTAIDDQLAFVRPAKLV